MSVGFFRVADRQVLLPLGLVMFCAKSCPSDFSGRRPIGTAAAGVGNVLCKILSVGFFGSQGGRICESLEVPSDFIAWTRALQRAKTHDPRKNERISEVNEVREIKEKRSIPNVCELLKGEQRRNQPLQNLFLLFCGGNLVPTRGEKPQFTHRKWGFFDEVRY